MKLLSPYLYCLLLSCLGQNCLAQNAAPILLATHDQAPYGSYLANQRFDGIAVKVVSCVLTRMKQAFVIKVYPWERAQVMAEKAQVDGFFPATLKPERLLWAEATAVIAEQKWVWYLPANTQLDPTSADFKAKAKVGAHFGSNRLKFLQEQGYQVVLTPQTDELLLKAFLLGRADAILAGNLAIAAAMQQSKIPVDTLKTFIHKDQPLHAYFGRRFLETHPDFISQFNAQLSTCR
ncbi:substrate-binding periplasmic protein [Undibacterium parvum]|uniref:Amino acid ABC transporter substrate-binding protein n=2 Tax=Undibacterium TaxID=401469 RepID=A0A6M4AAD9_9BURK|nr:transporter substrate-binding domain-containing protein [Undibacterium parvum]AZP13360.1 transporter substrate-binding domain-containing protein [Undibacterium parvum]QJQ07417.1 amino acid ABC transporter substrate-binding protein [Undibacterium piscinae]